MLKLRPDQRRRLREVLTRSLALYNDTDLQALFGDDRIEPWKHRIPETKNLALRVNRLITFLKDHEHSHYHHENALILFLKVLADETPPGDNLHNELSTLADELQSNLCPPPEAEEEENPKLTRSLPSWISGILVIIVMALVSYLVLWIWPEQTSHLVDFILISTPTLTLELSPTTTPTLTRTATPILIPTSTPAFTPTLTPTPNYEIQPFNANQIVSIERFLANDRTAVNDIVFGEGNCLISAGENATLRFWPNGDGIFSPRDINAVTSLSLQDGQNLLAIGGNKWEVVLLDLTSMVTVSLPTTDFTVNLSFTKDGKWLAVSNGTHVQIWDIPNREIYSESSPYEWASLQFNKDGDLLVTGSLNLYTGESVRNVSVWQIAPKQLELACEVKDSKKIRSVAFFPNGKRIAFGDNTGKIYFANATNCQLIDFFSAHSEEITALTFNSSGNLLLSGASDGSIKIWDVDHSSTTLLQVLEGHESIVRKIIFDPEEKIIASGSIDGRVILWGLPRGEDVFTEMSCSYKLEQ